MVAFKARGASAASIVFVLVVWVTSARLAGSSSGASALRAGSAAWKPSPPTVRDTAETGRLVRAPPPSAPPRARQAWTEGTHAGAQEKAPSQALSRQALASPSP